MDFPIAQNIFAQPTKIFGKIKKRPPPPGCKVGSPGTGRFLIFPKYFPPATKIFSAIEKSILGNLNFENVFSHSQKIILRLGEGKFPKSKSDHPLGTPFCVVRGRVAFWTLGKNTILIQMLATYVSGVFFTPNKNRTHFICITHNRKTAYAFKVGKQGVYLAQSYDRSLAISQDGSRAVIDDWLWDVETGKRISEISGKSFRFTDDDKFLVSMDPFCIWCGKTGVLIRTIPVPWIVTAFCTSGAYVVMGCEDRTNKISKYHLIVYNMVMLKTDIITFAHTTPIHKLDVSDGYIISRGLDGDTKIRKLATGELCWGIRGCPYDVRGNRIAVTLNDKVAAIADLATGELVESFTHSDEVESVKLGNDYLVTKDKHDILRWWSLRTMETVFEKKCSSVSLHMSEDNTVFAQDVNGLNIFVFTG